MATNSSLKNQIANKGNGNQNTPQGYTVKQLMSASSVKNRFEETLGKKAPQFMASVINLVNGDTNLQKCDQMSVVSSAMVAAALDLPIDKNLGYAWVVPYGNKATFQMGYKGYIQLALRTGQYKNINVIEVYEGEVKSFNRLTEEIELEFEGKESDKVIGYVGYFELINGFRKTVYWSKDEIERHKKRFSKTGFVWKDNYDAMAKKTVIRNMLNKWGILSIDMQTAVTTDGNAVTQDFEQEDSGLVIDAEFSEVNEASEGQQEINFQDGEG
ncbi:recombinase RecT [Virgibacillus dokdonensis]|uniref:Recombination and repair protein RecT n=1 Tax=Virgibacillus dokdonensis TaxID=302167 RepID=A0A2K9J736_9BACI|nr:recombinase RecT [Virgibacillus dokdonensis]AUJ25160.1 recombination and repair protein RecT [Virgibacillus dokdonensis]